MDNFMETGRQNKSPDTGAAKKKNIGVKVNETTWRQFRSLAVAQGRNAGDLLDELMLEYIEKSRTDTAKQ
jgi:hypothetical protein